MTPDQGRAGRAGSGGRVGDSSAPALPPPPLLFLSTPPLICLFFLFCFTSSLPALSLLILLPPPHLICSLLLIPTYFGSSPPPNPTCFTPLAKRDRTAYPLPPLPLHSWGGRGAGDYMDVGGCYVFGIMGNGYFWILGLCSGSLEVFFSPSCGR